MEDLQETTRKTPGPSLACARPLAGKKPVPGPIRRAWHRCLLNYGLFSTSR